MWSQGRQATRSSLNLVKKQSVEAGEVSLGKRNTPPALTESQRDDNKATPIEQDAYEAGVTDKMIESLSVQFVESKLK